MTGLLHRVSDLRTLASSKLFSVFLLVWPSSKRTLWRTLAGFRQAFPAHSIVTDFGIKLFIECCPSLASLLRETFREKFARMLVCVCACVRACVRACARARARACVGVLLLVETQQAVSLTRACTHTRTHATSTMYRRINRNIIE